MWSERRYWQSRLQAEGRECYAKIYNNRRQLKLDFHWVVMKKTWFIELGERNDTVQRKRDREIKWGKSEEKEGSRGWWKAADLKRILFLWQHFESTEKHCVTFIVCMEGKICKSERRGKAKCYRNNKLHPRALYGKFANS